MSLQKNLKELLDAQVISPEIADRIQQYYEQKKQEPNNRLFIVFGVLGAILVGLGIILILAHNWDNLPKMVKLFFAFLPLLIGQGICGFTLLKKPDSITWRESSATFLFFAVGASIGLISQIYNIPGDLGTFLLTWAILCLPLVYVMQSSIVSLLYLGGITWYATETGYGYQNRNNHLHYYYWLLLLGVLP